MSAELRSLRVLLALDSCDLRKGAIRNAVDLAEGIEAFGIECVLCGALDNSFRDTARRLGIPTVRLRSRPYSRSKLPIYATSVAWLTARLGRIRPAIVHLNYMGWGPSLACAAHLRGIPVVARAGTGYDARNRTHKWVSAYVANSEAHGRLLLDSPVADKVVITGPLVERPIVGGSTEPDLPPKRPGGCRLLFLGQIVERKGIEVLIEALRHVTPAADLMLVGGDWDAEPYAREVRRRLDASEIGARVHLSNHRDDVAQLLQNSDVVVVPSLDDTLPRVIIEAMAAGRAVVATDVGGIPTLIDNGSTGVLVERGNSKALASALNRLVESPELRDQIGRAAHLRSELLFMPHAALERYAILYRSLVPATRSSGAPADTCAFSQQKNTRKT